jgi:hypothetical protein
MAASEWQDSWFFIIGCHRSGVTFARLVLERHTEIECRDELTSYAILRGRDGGMRRRRLGLVTPFLTEQLGAPTLWDLAWTREFANGYRGQPLIFMVRDACDSVASMCAVRAFRRSWIVAGVMPALRAKIERDRRFAERYRSELAALEARSYPDLATAAFYWRYKTEALIDYLALRLPVLPVRYEDLINQPRVELLRICEFLQVPWEASLLNRRLWEAAPLEPRLTGEVLCEPWTDEQIDEIRSFAGPLQSQFYGDARLPATLTPA